MTREKAKRKRAGGWAGHPMTQRRIKRKRNRAGRPAAGKFAKRLERAATAAARGFSWSLIRA